MKKTIFLFVFSCVFAISASFVLAAGEVTPNPAVPGSGMIVPGSSTGATQGSALPTTSSGSFINPIGPTTIEGVLGNIMSYLQKIAGTIAVIFIIIGGIMYMVTGGSKDTERAKKTVIFAIVGLAIVLAAPLFYQEIKAVLSGNNPGSALQQILLNILKLLLAIVGFLAIIMMVVGAIWMLTAVGDDDRYELGKKTAGYAILGLVIALSALIIANQVTSLIGGGSVAPNNPALPASSLPSGWNRGGQD
ncbi:MAG TPA: pilin [Candidatus Bathyarchaeia archaeon]|nr:pilin [Candidatus Bathyarchaeia archaeon]